MRKIVNLFIKILMAGMVMAFVFACIPFEGTLDEVRQNALVAPTNGRLEITIPDEYRLELEGKYVGGVPNNPDIGVIAAMGFEVNPDPEEVQNSTFIGGKIIDGKVTLKVWSWLGGITLANYNGSSTGMQINIYISNTERFIAEGENEYIVIAKFTNGKGTGEVSKRGDGGGGDGSSGKPYLVRSYDEFKMIGGGTWGLDKHYKQDIDFNIDNDKWAPRGGPFTGTYDGNGKTIFFETQTVTSGDFGLFSSIGSVGEVKNLRLASTDEGVTVDSSGGNIGMVAASVSGGTIRNVSSRVVLNVSCQNLTATYNIGGIAGELAGGFIRNSYNIGSQNASSGTFTGKQYIGGISGNVTQGEISNCWSQGGMEGASNSMLGGIAGRMGGDSPKIIKNCVSLYLNWNYGNVGLIWAANDSTDSSIVENDNYSNSGSNITGEGQSSSSGEDGTGVILADTETPTWWRTTAGWDNNWGGNNEDKPWTWGTPTFHFRPALWFDE